MTGWRDIIAYVLVVALGIILVVHFALFWLRGEALIYEHNRVVLGLETTLAVAILGLGVERIRDLVVKHRRRRNDEV